MPRWPTSDIVNASPYLSESKREETILAFLPLVKSIVGRMAINLPSFVDCEDLVEVGIIGLISAVDSYQPGRGASLKSHVYARIKGAVLDELRKLCFFPREFYHKLKNLQSVYQTLSSRLNRPPSLDELREAIDVTDEELGELLSALRGQKLISLNNHSDADSDGLAAMLECPKSNDPHQLAAADELKEKLAQALEELPARERQVLVLYYYQELLLKEISDLLDLSPARISQLHSRALYRLNQFLRKVR